MHYGRKMIIDITIIFQANIGSILVDVVMLVVCTIIG
jgi:hypothetical protein